MNDLDQEPLPPKHLWLVKWRSSVSYLVHAMVESLLIFPLALVLLISTVYTLIGIGIFGMWFTVPFVRKLASLALPRLNAAADSYGYSRIGPDPSGRVLESVARRETIITSVEALYRSALPVRLFVWGLTSVFLWPTRILALLLGPAAARYVWVEASLLRWVLTTPLDKARASAELDAPSSDRATATGSRSPVSSLGGGHGLVGMRERVGTLGGVLQAGPTADGGYSVRATLPLWKTQGSEPGQASVGD